MTISRARILKNTFAVDTAKTRLDGLPPDERARRDREELRGEARVRRIAREVLDARAEAERIVTAARAQAAAIAREAGEAAAKEAREREVARLAAGFLELEHREAAQKAKDVDRLVELAVVLAERLIGEAIEVSPTRVAELAAAAIQEARGARRVRIEACPDDVGALTEALSGLGVVTDIQPDPSLKRGSLIVHTDLGRVDARLEPQLARLATALREVLS